MATTLACADLGADCVATFTTEDADELMAHAALHAQRVHPELDLTPELVAQANTVMRQTSSVRTDSPGEHAPHG